MIVNTRVFNFRFTIGTLIVAFIVLAAYGFSNYNELKSNSDFLAHEKKLLLQELNDFIERYDELGFEQNSLKAQFEISKLRAKKAFDSLEVLNANLSVLSKYRAELMFLKRQNKILQSDSLNYVIENLVEVNEDISEALELQKAFNESLITKNFSLMKTIREGSMLFANSFDAKVYRMKNSGEKVETDKAGNAETFEVCFVLAENPLVTKGTKNLYIQILGPDNNIVNDKGAVNFGEYSLIYSMNLNVEYNNSSQEFCTEIPNNESFKEGVYYISVFENERQLGRTEIELN